MKQLLQSLNWKNFLQRTLLFFFVFVIIRIIVDSVEGSFSINRILQQSVIRYFIFALVLGLLDSETWLGKQSEDKEPAPVQFPNFSSALLHYASVAFFISILCGIILTFFFFIRWLVSQMSDSQPLPLFPNWKIYFLVIAIIGLCFAGYDAWRNYRKNKKNP
jgi:magnesium-transporting ATPase (P-type)